VTGGRYLTGGIAVTAEGAGMGGIAEDSTAGSDDRSTVAVSTAAGITIEPVFIYNI
jgi:hypothetical protein